MRNCFQRNRSALDVLGHDAKAGEKRNESKLPSNQGTRAAGKAGSWSQLTSGSRLLTAQCRVSSEASPGPVDNKR